MTLPSGAPTTIAVLLVEDEPLIRMLAADVLGDEGFRVVEAANAQEALTLLEARSDVRVMVTDVHMPGSLDGFQLAQTVARRWPGIGIIVASSHALPRDSTMPDGARFLGKPYQPSILVREVHALVEQADEAAPAIRPEAAIVVEEVSLSDFVAGTAQVETAREKDDEAE